MFMIQTYSLANKARAKLSLERAHSNAQLRRVVAHANLVNNLIEELAIAEREQGTWHENRVASESGHDSNSMAVGNVHCDADSNYSDDSDSDDELDEEYDGMRGDVLGEEHARPELMSTRSREPPELHQISDTSADESMPLAPLSPAVITLLEEEAKRDLHNKNHIFMLSYNYLQRPNLERIVLKHQISCLVDC